MDRNTSDADTITHGAVVELPLTPGQPQEQLTVQDAPARSDGGGGGDDVVYPTGIKLWMAVISCCTVSFLWGLDLTIVAAAVPSLTNYFGTLEDIGWYSSAYALMKASVSFLFGKLYGIVPVKTLYVASICIFELGSLLCTVAPTSWAFILGRAVAGVGAAGLGTGSIVILTQCFPLHKRSVWITVLGSVQLMGIISAPLVGGVLIDWVGWRGCFGVNLPLGVAAIALVSFNLQNIVPTAGAGLPWKDQLRRFDWFGTAFITPAVICLLLALQWGGGRYGWADARIAALFVLSAVLLAAFGWRQHQLQEDATLPPRILRSRSVLAAVWYSACIDATLSVTEYYMSIYFQGVKGYTALRSGLLILPMLAGITIGNLLGGAGIAWLGYCNPFMFATTLLAPVASGLLTTISLDESIAKVMCLLGFLGLSAGIGIQTPIVALQGIMKPNDLPIGIAATAFGATMGSAVWIVVSATLFQSRLVAELATYSPSANATLISNAGLSDIANIVGGDRLRDVLLGYDEAVAQTLYLPLGLAAATVLGSVFTEWRSLKKKQA
ncbi:major facilitator superfamily domain-containing protein [Xylariales sp. PMI_506]|nr:major facilitator superfamily domain-containing protein [Xylariales sp. PMI_506]